jgi:putative addiction module killer protein
LGRLRDSMVRVRIARRLTRVQAGLLGDWKPARGGVMELREDFGPGYRLYCARHGARVIVLLDGSDQRTRQRNIERAQAYWQDWQRRRAD